MNILRSRPMVRSGTKRDQSGINMVDLMMWLVIAALMLAAAIQGIGYYQQAAYVYQAKNDVTHGHEWAAATTSITSKIPTLVDMRTALDDDDYRLSNDNDSALLAAQNQSYCLGVEAGNVLGDNVFYAHSDSPANIIRAAEMPESCGDLVAVPGPNAPSGPGGENGGSDGGNVANDMDDDGITNDADDDLDGDGLLNNNDGDVDNDGTSNASDTDIDGDGILNTEDETPNGEQNKITFSEPTGTPSIDPRVAISNVNYLDDRKSIQVVFAIDTFGIPNNTGPYYGLSVRITCQLDDGTRYYKHNWMWSSYEGDTPPNPTVNFACPGGTPVGYVAGAAYAAPELTANSGQKGPKNVGRGGSQLLTGNVSGEPSFGSYIDPRVSLRKVESASSGEAIVIGFALDLGGVSSSKYYGVSWRITCELADGSDFYKHGSMYTSYDNSSTYPAPDYTTPVCGGGAKVIGYMAGPYLGNPELTSNSGHSGPTNTVSRATQSLSNDPGIAPVGGSIDQRVTVRNVTYNGTTASIGINLDLGGTANTDTYWGYSYRLTCESSAGAKSYVTGSLYTTYNRSAFPAPSYTSKVCPTGTTVVGHVVGTYGGHAALTSNQTQPGPKNVLVGGKQ